MENQAEMSNKQEQVKRNTSTVEQEKIGQIGKTVKPGKIGQVGNTVKPGQIEQVGNTVRPEQVGHNGIAEEPILTLEDVSNDVEDGEKLKTKALKGSQGFRAAVKFYEKQMDIAEQYVVSEMGEYASTILKENEEIFKEIRVQLSLLMRDEDQREYYEDKFQKLQRRKIELLQVIKGNTGDKGSNQISIKPIEIPPFSGSIKKWPTFCELFEVMIIQNKNLSKIQKMQYLKTTVIDEAAQYIANLEITAENFDKAWRILTNQYEDKRAVKNASIEMLMELPALEEGDGIQMKTLNIKIMECIELLKETTANDFILYILSSKLPESTRFDYEKTLANPTEEQNLEEFLKFINNTCKRMENIQRFTNYQNN